MTELKKHLTINLEGPFKPGDSFVHLKRKRVITNDGLWITPGDAHLKKLLELTGLHWSSTGRDTPQTKDLSSIQEAEPLSPEDGTLFRSITGILMYLANDRPDVQYTVNELACAMAKPSRQALEAAKHLVRYLLKTKDFGIFFSNTWEDTDQPTVWTDTVTGQGTSRRDVQELRSMHLCDCLLYSYTRRHTVVAQSSAEAELYATASGVSEGILLRKVLAFFGYTVGLQTITDSSANNAVSHRLGVGKIRHLETKVLWLQDLVYDGRLVMRWIRGQQNPADLGTKVLQKKRIQELCKMAGIGPLNDSVGVRSITAGSHPANWEGIPIGKLLALATLVSQVPGIRGTELVVPDHTTSIWTMESLLLGFLILLVLVWFGIWGLCYLCGKKQAQKIQMKLTLYKGKDSTRIHLRKDCRALKNSTTVQEWPVCQFCTEAWLQPKVD
jgi:hypothetical protein